MHAQQKSLAVWGEKLPNVCARKNIHTFNYKSRSNGKTQTAQPPQLLLLLFAIRWCRWQCSIFCLLLLPAAAGCWHCVNLKMYSSTWGYKVPNGFLLFTKKHNCQQASKWTRDLANPHLFNFNVPFVMCSVFSHGRLYWPNCTFYGHDALFLLLLCWCVLLFTIAVVFVFGRLTHREKHNKMLKSNHMIPKIVTVCIRKTYAFVACISISQRKKLPTDRPFESTNIPNVRTNVKIQKIIERKKQKWKISTGIVGWFSACFHSLVRAFNCLGSLASTLILMVFVYVCALFVWAFGNCS